MKLPSTEVVQESKIWVLYIDILTIQLEVVILIDPNSVFQTVFDKAPSLTAILSPDGEIYAVNQSFVALSGIEREDIINHAYWDLPCWIHSDDMQNRILFAIEEAALTSQTVRFEAQYKDLNGKINDLDLKIKPVFDSTDQVEYYIAFGYNVTELVKARRALSNQQRHLTALFNHSKEGFLFNIMPEGLKVDDGIDQKALINDSIRYLKIVEFNSALEQIVGITSTEKLQYTRFYELLKISGSLYKTCVTAIIEHGEFHFEHEFLNALGEYKILEVTLSIIKNDDTYYGFFAVIRDLTIQKIYEAELEYFANNDPLTGLRNRRYYFSFLDKVFSDPNHSGFICMFDLDHFKNINDSYGHDMGDEVLKKFSEIAKSHFKSYAEICRYGGEEFLVYLSLVDSESVYQLLDDFRRKVSDIEFKPENQSPFSITVSVGIASCPITTPLNIVISRADKALYQSKNNGRNQVTICEEQ